MGMIKLLKLHIFPSAGDILYEHTWYWHTDTDDSKSLFSAVRSLVLEAGAGDLMGLSFDMGQSQPVKLTALRYGKLLFGIWYHCSNNGDVDQTQVKSIISTIAPVFVNMAREDISNKRKRMEGGQVPRIGNLPNFRNFLEEVSSKVEES